ncbi:MAG: hypothetical protein AAF657_22405 [Acidobacteriota bacterium]
MRRLQAEPPPDLRIRAVLAAAIGGTYLELGDVVAARRHIEEAARLRALQPVPGLEGLDHLLQKLDAASPPRAGPEGSVAQATEQ